MSSVSDLYSLARISDHVLSFVLSFILRGSIVTPSADRVPAAPCDATLHPLAEAGDAPHELLRVVVVRLLRREDLGNAVRERLAGFIGPNRSWNVDS